MIRLLVRRKNGKFISNGMDRLLTHRKGDTIWADVVDPSEEDMEKLIMSFELHPLAVEDCLAKTNNIKLDVYDDHLFIIFTTPVFKGSANKVAIRYLFIFFARDYIITLHSHPVPILENLIERLVKNPSLMQRGTGYLLHRILDTIVDQYGIVNQALEKRIAKLEDMVLVNTDEKYLNLIFNLKKFINRSRQHTYYKLGVLDHLIRNTSAYLSDDIVLRLKDVRDHLVTMSDALDRDRDSLTTLLSIFLNASSHNLSEVMKVLTVISIVFMPLNVIAGIGGMSEFSMMTRGIPWPVSYGVFTIGLIALGGLTYLFVRNLGLKNRLAAQKKMSANTRK